MKTIKISIIFLSCIQFVNAQFDEKFYFPKKEWKEINIPYIEEFIPIENDTLHTAFFRPEKEIKATVLFFHGAGGNISTYFYMIKEIVQKGYQVYAIDFRGYGKSTGKPTHINVEEDAEIIYLKMKRNEHLKNKKLIVYGASLGCQIATTFTKKHQDEIDGLILDGGFSSFADIAKRYAPEEVHPYIENALGSMYPSKEAIKKIKNVPKLFIHGKNDTSIPIHQSQLVFNNAQEPKYFFESKKGHLEALPFETEHVFKYIDKLLTIQQ